jgi:hypothetical protein
MSNKKMSKKAKMTTMKLLGETKLRLEKLREHKRETYDEVLRKILYVLNTAREDPFKAKKILERIEEIRDKTLEEKKQMKEDLKKEQEEEN